MEYIKLIVVGKLKEDYLRNKAFEYERLIEKKNKIKVIELLDESIPKNAKESINGIVKEKEGDKILEQIKNVTKTGELHKLIEVKNLIL